MKTAFEAIVFSVVVAVFLVLFGLAPELDLRLTEAYGR